MDIMGLAMKRTMILMFVDIVIVSNCSLSNESRISVIFWLPNKYTFHSYLAIIIDDVMVKVVTQNRKMVKTIIKEIGRREEAMCTRLRLPT